MRTHIYLLTEEEEIYLLTEEEELVVEQRRWGVT
jgi:hypothetical protein